jgi:hypothetical protein
LPALALPQSQDIVGDDVEVRFPGIGINGDFVLAAIGEADLVIASLGAGGFGDVLAVRSWIKRPSTVGGRAPSTVRNTDASMIRLGAGEIAVITLATQLHVDQAKP